MGIAAKQKLERDMGKNKTKMRKKTFGLHAI